MSLIDGPRTGARRPSPLGVSNRLASTRNGGQMVKEYWERIFTARERGAHVVWYNGAALNPIFQAAGIEGATARRSARAWPRCISRVRRSSPARSTGTSTSSARTRGRTWGARSSHSRARAGRAGVVGLTDQETLAGRLPKPDFFVNAYAGCSTGQQWDEVSYRIFDKDLPIFKVSYPLLWGNKPDAGYLRGEEWEDASRYVAKQLPRADRMIQVQPAASSTGTSCASRCTTSSAPPSCGSRRWRLQGHAAPATYWDWIASIAPINFLPGNQELVDYFAGMRDEIAQRCRTMSRRCRTSATGSRSTAS